MAVRTKARLGGFTVGIIAVLSVSLIFVGHQTALAAACAAPSTDYGTATATLSVPATATYRIWTRMMIPDTSNNTYMLQVDGATCYNVGGSGVPANTWTWVAYRDGNTASVAQQSLAQGTRTLKLIGNKPGVKVDRVIALSDLGCVPKTSTGDDCNIPSDKTAPTVILTAPAEGASLSGAQTITATASDNVGVTRVEFYDNGVHLGDDTDAPYTFSWNTALYPNGSHSVTVKAYDAAGNVSSDSSTVDITNGDSKAPTVPTSVTATAQAYNKVHVSWKASTDDGGVQGYTVTRDDAPLAEVGNVTSYDDTTTAPGTSYVYKLIALDMAGNHSAPSAGATVKTPTVADSQAPSTPSGLTATLVNFSQVNLTWDASTDNIGVVGYDVYQTIGSGKPTKIATVPTNSFGNTGLHQKTKYTYWVTARDASGNVSPASGTATVTTSIRKAMHTISGVVSDSKTHKPLVGARVALHDDHTKALYYTGQDGSYTLQVGRTARYTLTYSARGYHAKSKTVLVDASSVVIQNAELVNK